MSSIYSGIYKGKFSEIANCARTGHMEKQNMTFKIEDIMMHTVSDLCNVKCDLTYDSIYRLGTHFLFSWLAHAMFDICSNEVNSLVDVNLNKVLNLQEQKTTPLHEMRARFNSLNNESLDLIWSQYNMVSMYKFLDVLTKFDFSEFDFSEFDFSGFDDTFRVKCNMIASGLGDKIASFVSGEKKMTNIDKYMLYLLQTRGIDNVDTFFLYSYRAVCGCGLFDGHYVFDLHVGILLTMLSNYATYEEHVNVLETGEPYFSEDCIVRIIKGITLLGDYKGKRGYTHGQR